MEKHAEILPGWVMRSEFEFSVMKTYKTLCLLATLLLAQLICPSFTYAAKGDDMLIYCFFRGNGENGVYLAASEDGITFTPLNGDKPVMKPASWKNQNLTRDPSIVFHEGTFHLVWTTGWNGNCFGYAESKDLVHWSEPLRVEPFQDGQKPNNAWAPEICWDPYQKDFMIFWSSVVPPNKSRIFMTRTKDGKTFSAATLFLSRDFHVIDGQLLDDAPNNRWLLVYKNENPAAEGGKNIRLATAPHDFSKPFVDLFDQAIVGAGTSIQGDQGEKSMGEGPSLAWWNNTYYLYWDAVLLGHYGLATSNDLKTWTDRTAELHMPPQPRHGTVFHAPRSAVGWLNGSVPVANPAHNLRIQYARTP